MNTPSRLAAFGVGLVAVFAAATGLGAAVGPIGPVGPPAEEISPADHAPAPAETPPGTQHEEHEP